MMDTERSIQAASGLIDDRLLKHPTKSANSIFNSHSQAENLVGANAVGALMTQAADPNGAGMEQCGGCLVVQFIRRPLPGAYAANELMRWIDGDGDGKIGRDEWHVAADLLGITAGVDELSHDVRRMQLEHLAATSYTRLCTANANDAKGVLAIDAKGMLGRDVILGGGPMSHGQPEAMRVIKVPEDGRVRGWMAGNKPKGFDLKGRLSGEVLANVLLRYKGNTQGIGWTPAPPTEACMLGVVQQLGGPAAVRNPFVDALHTEPVLREQPPQATLTGEQLAAMRACCVCFAESTYRACGPVPMFVTPLGFFIHALMFAAPCSVCCIVPCQKADAARAHSLVLRQSTLQVRS